MLRKLLLGTALATFGVIGAANAKLIDSFDDPAGATISGPPCDAVEFQCVSQSGTKTSGGVLTLAAQVVQNNPFTGTGIIGGTRSMVVTVVDILTPSTGTNFGTVTARVSDGGDLNHSQSSAMIANTTITWNNNNAAGGFAAADRDLTDAGASNTFRIRVVSADAGIQWRLTVTDGDSSDFITFNTGSFISNVELFESFNLFTGIDFTNVRSITFTANDGNAADVDTRIASIDTIPEPATLALFGAGLAGLGLLSRRRRKA